jgi:hypothetical protein
MGKLNGGLDRMPSSSGLNGTHHSRSAFEAIASEAE